MAFVTAIDSEVVNSSTYTSDGIGLRKDVSIFSMYYSISGEGSVDFFAYYSPDGYHFVKDSVALKRGVVAGEGMLHLPIIPCDAFKIEAEETAGSATTVTVKVVLLPGQFGDFPVYDGITNGIKTIEYAHHEVHDGDAFWCEVAATLGNGEVATIGFVTPNTTEWAHLLLRVDLTAAATFDILEDVTSFDGGAAYTAKNFNRNSTNTSSMTITNGYTGSDLITPTGGTSIWC